MTRIVIARREWRAVALFSLLVLALTTLPYIVAWASQGEDWRFSGFLFGIEDGHSYLGKMRLGARGLWEFSLFYTPEPHDGAALVFLPYIVPGQIVGRFIAEADPALTSALAVTFHVLRIAADALLLVVLYRFIAAFVTEPSSRLLALFLATVGGGFGWLLVGVGDLPPEFYIPEGFSALILLGLPHLALARAALLGGLALLVGVLDDRRWLMTAIAAGVCWLVVGLAVPFYLAVVYAILAAWGLAAWLRRRRFPVALARRTGLAALITAPLVLYYAVTFSTNPAFARWSAQNRLESPPPLHYLLAYLPLLIPALAGVRSVWREAGTRLPFALLVGWPLAVPVLIYLPINVQRRLGEAVIVPLAILAVVGLEQWARRAGRWPAIAVSAVASVSTVLLLAGAFAAATRPDRPLFHPLAEVAAFDWLNAMAAPDDVALAAVPTGNALPAYTRLRTFMGHGPETLDWPRKTEAVERFYDGVMSAAERAALLAEYRIRYVLYGPLERALNPRPDAEPSWAEGLTLVYDRDGYRIYRVG